MKAIIFVIVTAVFLIFNSVQAQKCLPFDGYINDQTMIDYIHVLYPGCTEIDGTLIIGDNVTSLDSLYRIKQIKGSLLIDNTDIKSLKGLHFLDSISGGVTITSNKLLKDISDFNRLKKVRGVNISSNPVLETINSFDSIVDIPNNIMIKENPILESITGFSQVQKANTVEITDNDSLQTIDAFKRINQITRDILIHNNSKLSVIEAFRNLKEVEKKIYIRGCPFIKDLSCFDSLLLCEFISIFHTDTPIFDFFPSLIMADHIGIESLKIKKVIGFNQLKETNGLVLSGPLMNHLQMIDGFNALDSLRSFSVTNHSAANFIIRGFSNVKKMSSLSIRSINFLTELNAFGKLEEVDELHIDQLLSSPITNLNNFGSLRKINELLYIVDNPKMNDISALKNIDLNSIGSSDYVGDYIVIKDNKNLSICNELSICKFIKDYPTKSYIYSNAPGCNSVEEVMEACKTVSTQTPSSYLKIYPNPAFDVIHIESDEVPTDVVLFNMVGEIVLKPKVSDQSISMDSLPGGLYLLHFTLGSKTYKEKIIIIK